MGVPDHLTCLLRNLYAGQKAAFRIRHGTTDWFEIGKEVDCHTVYLTSMQITPCKMSGWVQKCQVCWKEYQQPQICRIQFSSVQSLSHVWLFAIPWTTACQATLSITNSQSPPKPMSIVSVMPSNHLILCHPLLLLPPIFPTSGSFQMSQLFTWGGQSIGVSASTLVPPMNTQDWSPLGWTAWISLQSKGLSRVFSNTTIQQHQFFGVQLSSQFNSHIHTWPLEKR